MEVTLTKFVSYKVYHHCVYAIISTVILSSGLAGTTIFLKPELLAKDDARCRSRMSVVCFLYAITLPLATLLFAWCPIGPYSTNVDQWVRIVILPVYFIIFGVPFFFAGLSISHLFATARVSIRRLFFFDLVAAALGAALCPFCLETFGGYGTVAISAVLGMVACVLFRKLSQVADETAAQAKQAGGAWLAQSGSFAVIILLTLAYQPWALAHLGYDIHSSREVFLKDLVLKDFNGVDQVYWNAIARIDVSHEGHSANQLFTYSFAERFRSHMPRGKMVMVDGSAPTRQFRIEGTIKDNPFIGTCLWATPYVVRQKPDPVLVIAGGGGSDILAAKYYGIPRLDVVEINPATFKHVLQDGKSDERKYYQDALLSDANTKVTLFNKEGRHFCSTRPNGYYEVIQASAADTCTAISSGALAMAENHLYTIDAVRDFMRVLKPDGVLSLSHWRADPPTTSLRMIATYLGYLDSEHVPDPYKYVLAIGDGQWCDLVLKRSPFTQEEMQRVRKWAEETDKAVLLDPLAEGGARRFPSEVIFDRIARAASPEERRKVEDAYVLEITPVTDDKPFFYNGTNWARNDALYWLMFICAAIVASLLVILPIIKPDRRALASSFLGSAVMFALSGFAFLLFELAIMQKLTVFVGGPIYAMCVVLVSVLFGYGLGSLIAERLPLSRKTFLMLAIVVPLFMVAAYFCLPGIISSCMPLPMPVRVTTAVALTIALSMITGMPVPTAMAAVRAKDESAIAWMWGINCAFNGIGAMSFALLTAQWGVQICFLLVAAIYLVANVLFSINGPLPATQDQKATAIAPGDLQAEKGKT